MVLENEGAVLVAKCVGDIVALLFGEYHTAKVFVESALSVKRAAVLSRDLDVPAQGGESFSIHGVRVASCVEIRTRGVNGVVDGKGSLVVEHSFGTTAIDDAAVRTNEQQVRHCHVSKRYTEWVHPKVVLLDRVSEGQVTSNTFIEAEHTKHSEGLSQPLLSATSFILECIVGDRLIKMRRSAWAKRRTVLVSFRDTNAEQGLDATAI